MNKLLTILLSLYSILFVSCGSGQSNTTDNNRDTIFVHDTVMPEGEITYNIPCRVISVNQSKPGKSVCFLWLHGGVNTQEYHDYFGPRRHIDCCAAQDSVIKYFRTKGIKAIALLPVCHKASINHCVTWRACISDIKHIIDTYNRQGLIDYTRIYIAGSSDGGAGTWDFISEYPDFFATAMPMSCAGPRFINQTPVYFSNTGSEPDCTAQVNELIQKGATIEYKRYSEYKHGRDDIEVTESFLDKFFSNINSK